MATFKEHLILLPTSNSETSCYHKKLTFDNRPLAKKLTIEPKHLKMCKVANLQLVPAHFNESRDQAERYIVSGFDDYVVVWSLNRIVNNNDFVYTVRACFMVVLESRGVCGQRRIQVRRYQQDDYGDQQASPS